MSVAVLSRIHAVHFTAPTAVKNVAAVCAAFGTVLYFATRDAADESDLKRLKTTEDLRDLKDDLLAFKVAQARSNATLEAKLDRLLARGGGG